ncbi:MAG TPA: hypothetical protein VD816_08360 [Ohtaekwangia sp.]|nr:hypothetical protein [Ohtaekwangia sp.]
MSALYQAFLNTSSNHSRDANMISTCWDEILKAYSEPSRTYHNLHHLHHFLEQVTSVKHLVHEWDCVIFSLVYHDFICDPLATDNESRSAALAAMRLTALNVPAEKINLCREMIMATRGHYRHEHGDINFFTDADLAILGATPSAYGAYMNAVRKEYALVPESVYRAGRIKILKHFLALAEIYKTPEFRRRYEAQARENMLKEVNT